MENQQLKSSQQLVEEWVHSFGDDLFRWALYKTSDREIAEDLVQETFLAAYKSVGSFKEQSNPKTWIFRILNNKIIDHYRKASKAVFVDINDPHSVISKSFNKQFDKSDNWKLTGYEQKWESETHLLDDPDFNKILENCIEDLPPAWKISVMSKYFLEKDAQEICKELGITSSNYWQVQHRAKILLKKCIEKKWFNNA